MNETTLVDDRAVHPPAALPQARGSSGVFRRLLREPLLQFLVLGAGIFLVTQYLAERRAQAAHTIVVDSSRMQRLSQLYRVQMGSEPSQAELDYLIEGYVRDEVLYREALKLGLNREDEIIRRRLVQKMEFLNSDLAALAEPSEEALLAHYDTHVERFSVPATATFAHVFFSADAHGDAAARTNATSHLAKLAAQDGSVAARHGDPFPLQHSYAGLSATEVAQIFGRTPFVAALFSEPEGRWQGPVRSGYGWHLIFVHKRMPETPLPFADIRAQVREAYLDERRRAANEQRIEALAAGYTIARTAPRAELP